MNVLEAARRFNAELKIVHVGTSTQIGRMRRVPVDEDDAEMPMDIYAARALRSPIAAQHLAELIVIEARRAAKAVGGC